MDLNAQLLIQQRHWAGQRNRPVATRVEQLKKLENMLLDNKTELAAAVSKDFGNRSLYETLFAEILSCVKDIRHIRKHLHSWSRRQRVGVGWQLWPARAWVDYQPKGVIGIMAPWNYPISLVIEPLAAALAAGNTAMIKPSEAVPETGALLKRLLAENFPEEMVYVALGEVEVSRKFAALPFDHLLFTGSTEVGKAVMRAAAENLTPVTLELGGKSPAYIANDSSLKDAARLIGRGKFINAGQTCIAPDYILIGRGRAEEFAAELSKWLQSSYPDLATNTDYTRIINAGQFARLDSVLSELENQPDADGMLQKPLGERNTEKCLLPPVLVLNPDLDSSVMKSEIFGPILPIIEVDSYSAALEFINQRPRPLAAYYFGKKDAQDFTGSISTGGICINDTLLHFAVSGLPFGGIGASGMGAYHGKTGFETFSHRLPVFKQSRLSGSHFLQPPWKGFAAKMIKWLVR